MAEFFKGPSNFFGRPIAPSLLNASVRTINFHNEQKGELLLPAQLINKALLIASSITNTSIFVPKMNEQGKRDQKQSQDHTLSPDWLTPQTRKKARREKKVQLCYYEWYNVDRTISLL